MLGINSLKGPLNKVPQKHLDRTTPRSCMVSIYDNRMRISQGERRGACEQVGPKVLSRGTDRSGDCGR